MRRNKQNEDMGNKIIKYATIGVLVLTVIVIGLLIYSQSLTEEVKEGTLNTEQIASLANRTSENTTTNYNSNTEETETTTTEMGKSVNESQNELKNEQSNTNTVKNTTSKNNTTSTTNTVNMTNKNTTTKKTNTSNTATTNTEIKEEPKQRELQFVKPVEGDIMKEYAKENLLFSETLQEWVIHTGIDIKADKTTVVKSAEAGTVKSIKNDPRYGLTIVVEHDNGFQTVYSNLLTSEFVVEGEKVEKEQSLGTVGNTAAFESSDEPHLHFEILKDNVQVDPSIYLK